MERLTERFENGQVGVAGCGKSCKHDHRFCENAREDCPTFEDIYKKLATYEDAEEQGLPLRWIPCSERLPDEAFGCLVTVMDCEPSTQTEFENILPYFVGYDGETWNDADGEEIPFEVIAWQKLPQPYQPKGE